MEVSTLNHKIAIITSAKLIELEKVDWIVVDYPTQTIALWRGKQHDILYKQINAYNGSTTLPSFDSIVADIQKLVGEPTTYDVVSTALEASHVVKSSPGYLTNLTVYNDSASAVCFQLHDATALPANGTVPVFSFLVATKSTVNLPLGDGLSFSKGIVVAGSSTAATLTVAGSIAWFMASYI